MKLLYFDCGSNDEFNLSIGARIFSKRCRDRNINHEYMNLKEVILIQAIDIIHLYKEYGMLLDEFGIEMIRSTQALYGYIRFDFRIVDN